MYFTYIIQSVKDQSYYIGYSGSPRKRLEKHNTSRKGYTSTKQPWRLVFIQSYETKTEAIKREKQLKSWKDKSLLSSLIHSGLNEL